MLISARNTNLTTRNVWQKLSCTHVWQKCLIILQFWWAFAIIYSLSFLRFIDNVNNRCKLLSRILNHVFVLYENLIPFKNVDICPSNTQISTSSMDKWSEVLIIVRRFVIIKTPYDWEYDLIIKINGDVCLRFWCVPFKVSCFSLVSISVDWLN